MASNGFVSFLMGATGAGLFSKAIRPGAPTQFVDSRSVEEYLASGEFEITLKKYPAYVPDRSDLHPDPRYERRMSSAVSGQDAAAAR